MGRAAFLPLSEMLSGLTESTSQKRIFKVPHAPLLPPCLPAGFSLQLQLGHRLVALPQGYARALRGSSGHIPAPDPLTPPRGLSPCPPPRPAVMLSQAPWPHRLHPPLVCGVWGDTERWQGKDAVPTAPSHLLLPGQDHMPKGGFTVGADGRLADLCGQGHGKERPSAVPDEGQ